jgi:CBS domain-containing protein
MRAAELMTRGVISVREETTVEEIARILTRNRVSSVPVVDNDGHVVGIVSEHDLFMKDKGLPFTAVKLPERFKTWVTPDYVAQIYEAARHNTAADIMTRDVLCVDVDEEVGHVAWFMMQWGVERLPVLENDRLVGVIARSDLIRLLAEPAPAAVHSP